MLARKVIADADARDRAASGVPQQRTGDASATSPAASENLRIPANPEFIPPGLSPLQKLVLRVHGGIPNTGYLLEGLLGGDWRAPILGELLQVALSTPEHTDQVTLLIASMAAQARLERAEEPFEVRLLMEAHDWGLVTDTKCLGPKGGHCAVSPYVHRFDPLDVVLRRCDMSSIVRDLAENVLKGLLPEDGPGGVQDFVRRVDDLLNRLSDTAWIHVKDAGARCGAGLRSERFRKDWAKPWSEQHGLRRDTPNGEKAKYYEVASLDQCIRKIRMREPTVLSLQRPAKKRHLDGTWEDVGTDPIPRSPPHA